MQLEAHCILDTPPRDRTLLKLYARWSPQCRHEVYIYDEVLTKIPRIVILTIHSFDPQEMLFFELHWNHPLPHEGFIRFYTLHAQVSSCVSQWENISYKLNVLAGGKLLGELSLLSKLKAQPDPFYLSEWKDVVLKEKSSNKSTLNSATLKTLTHFVFAF